MYVHFPYCLQKCPYCDFASASIQRSDVPHSAYADAIVRELHARAEGLFAQRLSSVFFGGGTPSLWDPEELGRVLAAIKAAFPAEAAPDQPPLEVTVECNPSSLDQARAAALREVGVNRLSIGVQSLDDRHLRFLGRLHDSAGALAAVEQAQREMPRVSADLMFGVPGQTAADFLAEVDRLLALELSHLSVYALTIEPATQFGALHRKGRLQLAPEGDFAETFTRTHDALVARGFSHYEVSNYAQPGQTSRHNQHYWHGGAYLGLGAGAVGCLPAARPKGDALARRYRNSPDPLAYMQRAADDAREVFEEWLSPQDLVREALMLGLRTDRGIDLRALRARTGRDVFSGRADALQRHIARGNLVHDDHLRVPHSRWLHLDGILSDIF